MGLGQRRSGPGEDRVHRTRADPGAEELFDELDSVIAGDAVADRQRRHRRFKARPERAAGHLPGQRCARAPAALRAAHSLSAMLAHHDVDRRQPFDLVARRLADRNPLARAEDVPAVTALRPVLDDLVDCRCGQQRTPVTLMAILSAAFAPRPIPCYATAPKANRKLGGREELRELFLSSRSSLSTRASNCWTRRSIRSNTSTTTSHPASKIASASARSTPRDSTRQGYLPPPTERLLESAHLQGEAFRHSFGTFLLRVRNRLGGQRSTLPTDETLRI